ncbi:hypothetical protein BDV10DRAFT_178326 [Aspergillus recurvatus]
MRQLTNASRDAAARDVPVDPASSQIVAMLKAAKNDYKKLVQQRHDERLKMMEESDNSIFSENSTLVGRFQELLERLVKEEQGFEHYDRIICPNCGVIPDKHVITSCLHSYCRECYTALHKAAEVLMVGGPGQGNLEVPKPICKWCSTMIDEATRLTGSAKAMLLSLLAP